MSNVGVSLEGVDFSKSNVIFVDGLSLEKIKMKYNWLLNAKVKDAIVGENDKGLVWYCGEWYCGEWVDGTWYSGNFYNGIWKNGDWFSYDLNRFDIINGEFFIKQTNDDFSHFHNGVWLNGNFYRGIFGNNNDEDWEDFTLYTENKYPTYKKSKISEENDDYILEEKKLATWMNGNFYDGLFFDAIWGDGVHINGYVENSKWISGKWHNGTFNGHTWHNGTWFNGQFIKGDWLNGTFTTANKNIISRFGNTTLNTENNIAICNWYDGVWLNGEWFSGYIEDENRTPQDSIHNYLSVWHNGIWKNGIWFGGYFKNGTWENGTWKTGIFGAVFGVGVDIVSVGTPTLVSVIDKTLLFGEEWYDGNKWVGVGNNNNPTKTDGNISDVISCLYVEDEYFQWEEQDIKIDNLEIIDVNVGDEYIEFKDNNMLLSLELLTLTVGDTITRDITIHSNNFWTNELLTNYTTILSITKNGEEKHFNITDIIIIDNYPIITYKIKVDDWDTNHITSDIENIKILIKGNKTYFKNGCGTGKTYFSFDRTDKITIYANRPDYITFVSTDLTHQPSFRASDVVYIEPDEIIDGVFDASKYAYVFETGTTSEDYPYVVCYAPGITSNVSGKLYKVNDPFYFELDNVIEGQPITFQNFNFDLSNDFNFNDNKIIGIELGLDIEIVKNGESELGYEGGIISLPFKYLTLENIEYDSGSEKYDYTYNNTHETGYYNDLYRIQELPYNIPIGKNINLIQPEKTYNYGSPIDMWDLIGLETFYDGNNEYDPKNIKSILDNLRVSVNFKQKNTKTQILRIKNIVAKIHTSNKTTQTTTWQNGTFYRGLISNVEFNGGKIISALWINGNFNNGVVGGGYR